jgi:GNAT superfamily N-acetyltransferase
MTVTAVTIRVGRQSDAREIAQLTSQLGYDLAEGDAAARLSRIMARDDQRFLVADFDGRAIGWVHIVLVEYVDAEAFALIGGLVVDQAHRGSGIGRALLNSAENWARERGVSMVRLSSTVARTAAHRFYENLGYTKIKTQHSFIKPLDEAAVARVSTFVPRVEPLN